MWAGALNHNWPTVFSLLLCSFVVRGFAQPLLSSPVLSGEHLAFAREDAESRPGRLREWLIAGVMAGLACGAKLTAVPMLLLPLAAIGAFAAMLAARRLLADDRFRLLIGVFLFHVVAVLIFMRLGSVLGRRTGYVQPR